MSPASAASAATSAARGAAKPASPKSAERRELILDRAEALFTAHGFHGVSFAELARAAGLGNPGLVYHFPSKKKLYAEVLRRLAAELDDFVTEAFEAVDLDDTRGRLSTLIRVVATWSFQRSGKARLMMRELLDNVDRVERARTLPLASFVASCTELAERARRERVVHASDPLALLARIFGTIAYAQIVRPTFAKISGWRVVGDDRRWLDAIIEDLEASVFR